MKIHEESYGYIELIEDVPCVAWVPMGYSKSEDFRKLMMIGVDYYGQKKKEISNLVWLNDSRKMKVIGKEDQDWLESVVNMQAQKNGLKYMAFVLPDNIFGKIAVKLYVEATLKKMDMTIKTFNSYDKALAWLKETTMQPA